MRFKARTRRLLKHLDQKRIRIREIKEQGYFVQSAVFAPSELSYLQQEFDRVHSGLKPGERHFSFSEKFLSYLRGFEALNELVEVCLGRPGDLVRLIAFDKTKDANWGVPWHQDRTIAVVGRGDFPGFQAWQDRGDCFHVEPPVEFLEMMVTLRVHLDPAGEHNGALMVMSGSHLKGRLTQGQIASLTEQGNPLMCSVEAGDAMVMRPLLVHSSCSAVSPSRRRVLHLEYCAANLPDGLGWTV